ncbi:MAG: lipase family protein [Acidimicrobiia bacterium]|nr:lipase family protein [Acidimicrobiia bacterium]
MLRRLVSPIILMSLVVASSLALVAGSAAARGGGGFYAVPDPLPKAAPGTIIRSEPIPAPAGAKAWRVLYHSETVAGRDIAVSGVIVAPAGTAPKSGRPVVTWAHGTTGLADLCAPSKVKRVASKLPYVEDMVEAGYVVAATDYEGLGTPGLHPYLVGESEGRSVLDAARAAQELDRTGAGKDLLVFGHSQGGHAALFAGELAAQYAPEQRLLGIAAAAPAADLDVILPAAGAIPQAGGFVVMGAKGINAAYPEAEIDDVMAPEALAQSGIVEEQCAGEVVRAFSGGSTAVIARNPLEVSPWRELIHASSAGNRPAGAPVLVVQGEADQLVLRPLSDAWVKKACAAGDVVEYSTYPGADHGTVIDAARTDVLDWLAARVKGDAAPNGCSA